HERVDHDVARLAALLDQDVAHLGGLLRRIAAADALRFDDVGDAEIMEASLSLFEEEDQLVPRAVVIPHADRPLVPDERLPELEADALGDRLRDERRLRI